MINRLVVWGARDTLDSIRHVWRSYHENALKIGVDSIWVDDAGGYLPKPGDTVLAADVTAKHLPYVKGVDYVLHNFDGSHPICQQADPENIVRLQVWTHDATGVNWEQLRSYDKQARILFQPWGTDLLPSEFLDPVYNPHSRDATFVGAVWREMHQGQDLGNESAIQELKVACIDHNLNFKHLTQISTQDMVRELRSARITPAFAGGWQVTHGYIPCRVLKNPSYGCLSITNITEWGTVLGDQPDGTTIAELIGNALALEEEDYLNMVREQQAAVAPYNYQESLIAISRAFDEGRGGPQGFPFEEWKTTDMAEHRLLKERIDALEDILKDADAAMENASVYLEDYPDIADVLREIQQSYRSIITEDQHMFMSVNERAKQRLQRDNSTLALQASQFLRDVRERIRAA